MVLSRVIVNKCVQLLNETTLNAKIGVEADI